MPKKNNFKNYCFDLNGKIFFYFIVIQWEQENCGIVWLHKMPFLMFLYSDQAIPHSSDFHCVAFSDKQLEQLQNVNFFKIACLKCLNKVAHWRYYEVTSGKIWSDKVAILK